MIFAQKGNLVARLASGEHERQAAQSLRYQVFYQELSAAPDAMAIEHARDMDEFDDICDHLLVVRQTEHLENDGIRVRGGELVGTYRLLPHDRATASQGFYSQKEFDLAPLIASKPDTRFLELGRSCVQKKFRTRPVVELLWQGIWNYLRLNELDVMFGCASLEGTDVNALKLPLNFLQKKFRPPAEWHIKAHAHCRASFPAMAPDAINDRQALRALPPLIKGYLRLGAFVGEGVVPDHQFNTIDVLIILPVSAIDPRYFPRFGAPNQNPVAAKKNRQ